MSESAPQVIDGDKMTLIELADISYIEYVNITEEAADDQFKEECESFLHAARATARNRFGTTADQLQWTYTPNADLPNDIEEATAPLAPDRPEYLRYRYDHNAESATFELVQPCSACGHDRINEVTGIVELGRLLANAPETNRA